MSESLVGMCESVEVSTTETAALSTVNAALQQQTCAASLYGVGVSCETEIIALEMNN